MRDAWVREPPGGHPIAAAYMQIENPTTTAMVLTGADCSLGGRVEMHIMQHKDGKMTMRQVDKIEVPASGQVQLKPGGLHLMLMGMERAPKAGDEVELTLRFDGGAEKKIKAMVRKGGYAD